MPAVKDSDIKCEKCGRDLWSGLTIWHVNHGSPEDSPRFRCELHTAKTVSHQLVISHALSQINNGVTLQ